MIRKPDERDFRESAPINALHKTSELGVKAVKKTARGARKVMLYWFAGVFAFGFVMTGLTDVGVKAVPVMLLVFCIGFAVYKFWPKPSQALETEAVSAAPFPKIGQIDLRQKPYDALALPEKRYNYSALFLMQITVGALILPILTFSYFGFFDGSSSIFETIGVGIIGAALLYFVGGIWLDQTALSFDKDGLSIHAYWGKSHFRWLDIRELDIAGTNPLLSIGTTNNSFINVKVHNKSLPRPIRMSWFDSNGNIGTFRNTLHAEMVRYWKAAQERDIAEREKLDVFTRASTPSHNPTTSYQPMAIAPDPQPIVHDDLAAVRAEFAARRQHVQNSADADTVDHLRPRTAGFGRKGL